MTFYLDTSVVMTALTLERATPQILGWITERSKERFMISDWVITELSAALSVKLLSGQATAEDQASALAEFIELRATSFVHMSVASEDFRAAARLADRSRASDALHLAVARRVDAIMCTRDKGLAAACREFGIAVELL